MKIRPTGWRSPCLVTILAILAVSFVGFARADQPAPTGNAAPPSPDAYQSGSDQATPVLTTPPIPKPAPLPWYDLVFDERLPVELGIIAAELSSDNIFYQHKGTYDYITQLSPFLTLTLGTPINLIPTLDEESIDIKNDAGNLNYLQVVVRPTIALYDKNPRLDVVDEYEDAIYTHQFSKAAVSLEQRYEKLSQPTIETSAAGTLINRDIFTTTARGSYINSDKLSSYATFNQIISVFHSDLYTDSAEWNGEYYFLYQMFPKLSVGLGPKVGYINVEKSASQTYQEALVHLFYPATGKLSFSVAAGGELREYEHDESAETLTPVLDAEALYKPFDSMTISLDASRHRIVSNTQVGQDYTSDAVTLRVRQRFLQVMYFSLLGGYQDDQYTGAVGAGPTRDDNYFYVKGGVEWTSKDWLAIDGSYQYSRDDSNLEAFTFDENLFKVSVTMKY